MLCISINLNTKRLILGVQRMIRGNFGRDSIHLNNINNLGIMCKILKRKQSVPPRAATSFFDEDGIEKQAYSRDL